MWRVKLVSLVVVVQSCLFHLVYFPFQVSSLFTGEEEMFAWDRTVSRLTEMQTAQYWMERDREEETDYL